ncbi:MAG TPA: PorP/SprF family type IX secretion system membrane protein [Chitinophagales bacterium]|nr:PorP/SprF family type IX secretion system membrane protein [Chitinophagales bacterium]
MQVLKATLYFSVAAVFAAVFTRETRAQDVAFSQYIFNPVYLNPALAGISGGPRFIVNYRNQWPALTDAYVTYSASYDQHFPEIGGGVGFQILSDNQASGTYRQTAVSGAYNYMFVVSEKTAIRIGLQTAIQQHRIFWERLLFADEFDVETVLPGAVSQEMLPSFTNKTNVDFGAGMVLYGKKAYAGLVVKHVSQPNVSLYNERRAPLPMMISGNLGAEIKTKRNGRTYISPNLMYARQAKHSQIQGHLLVYRGPVLGGIGLRRAAQNTDAVIFYAGMRTGVFRAVYSYDNTYSNLRGRSGGAHELSMALNLNEGKKARRKARLKNSIDCPELL